MQYSALTYPQNLRDGIAKYPIVRFSATDENNEVQEVFFPMPQSGIAFNDGGSYGTIDLGIIGGSIDQAIQSEQGVVAGVSQAAKDVAASMKSAEGRSILANILTSGDLEQQIQFQQKKVIAPNTNSTFSNNTLRNFSFQFKLVSSSRNEAKVISEIDHAFRRLVYANSDIGSPQLVLSYPPLWNVGFYDWNGESLEENKFLPKVAPAYLSSFNSTFNASTNLFHDDGAPVETDMTLIFTESKVHSRSDIDDLNGRTGTGNVS